MLLSSGTTYLGLSGTPGRSTLLEESQPRSFTQTYTDRHVIGVPTQRRGPFTGKEALTDLEKEATDTWLVSWTEQDIDLQEIAASDTWRVSWTESTQLHRFYSASDTWTVNWSESVALAITGVTPKTGTDTWAVTFTESVVLSVTIDATDTWTVDWSEASDLETTAESIAGTDTWTVDWTEASLLGVFAGEVPVSTADTWAFTWNELAVVRLQGRIRRIVFNPIKPRIVFRKL